MKKIMLSAISLSFCAMLLQACTIPPARINWQTQPGKIQRVNCSPVSPYCNVHTEIPPHL